MLADTVYIDSKYCKAEYLTALEVWLTRAQTSDTSLGKSKKKCDVEKGGR